MAKPALIEKSASVLIPPRAPLATLRRIRVSTERGRWIKSPLAPHVMATVHPSAILRAPDDETRHAEYERFVHDLAAVAKVA